MDEYSALQAALPATDPATGEEHAWTLVHGWESEGDETGSPEMELALYRCERTGEEVRFERRAPA